LVIKALADITGIEAPALTHRIMGSWMPEDYTYDQLVGSKRPPMISHRPTRFFWLTLFRKHQKNANRPRRLGNALGAAENWQAEWKWDGIRAQMIKRNGEIFIWSRGEDLATEKFLSCIPS
jgi:DNA ligase-1